MKKIILFILLAVSTSANAQTSDKYQSLMERHIAILDTSNNPAWFAKCANNFERIAASKPTEWLPTYYYALSNARLAMASLGSDKPKADEYLTKAEKLIQQANEISPNNSEIKTVQAMVYGLQIAIDPMTRGQRLGMLSAATISKAMELDPTNPRATALKGQQLLMTPEQWGGGVQKGITMLETAVKKYETFTPASSLHPNWGKAYTEQALRAAQADNAPKEDKKD